MTPTRIAALEACAEALKQIAAMQKAVGGPPSFTFSYFVGDPNRPQQIWADAIAAVERLEEIEK